MKEQTMMEILNITFNVENEAVSQWKEFMNKIFFPYANVKSHFSGHNLYKVMVEDESTETYSYQLIAKDATAIAEFKAEIFPALVRELTQAFGNKVMLFDTILKEERF